MTANSDSVSSDPVTSDPVTLWIDQLRREDQSAAEKLWHHFVSRLQTNARHRLKPSTRRVYDEEDVAQSAFHSLCAGLLAGKFPDLNDRQGLWQLLLVITSRKVSRRVRYEQRQKRDERRLLNDSIFIHDESVQDPINQVCCKEPTPEFVAEFVEVCENLFDSLADPELQQVASLRMEGFNDSEIGQRLNCSRRTVQRRLEVIRRHWENLGSENE